MTIDLDNSPTIYRLLSGSIDSVHYGKDEYLYNQSGSTMYDLSGGPCVSSLGHGNKEMIAAISKAVNDIPYTYSGFWGTKYSEELGEAIKNKFNSFPNWFGKVAFACSGNEAVEFACRIAYQYWAEQGEKKTYIASREFSFHGTSAFTSALTDDYGRYSLMEDWYNDIRRIKVVRLPGYVGPPADKKREEYEKELLNLTETKIIEAISQGKSIAALILEPVGGPPVGAAEPSKIYLEGLRYLCDKYSILLIFDEVLCGCGRVGTFTAAQLYGIKPDIILLGKSLTGGYLPLSAVVVSNHVIDCLQQNSGVAMIGTTYLNHPASCAAALKALKIMDSESLIENVKRLGYVAKSYLKDLLSIVPIVEEVNGIGYLWGIRLRNPDTFTPFDPHLEMHKHLRKLLYDNCIITYTKGQTVNGLEDYIIMSPPFNCNFNILLSKFEKIGELLKDFDWRSV